MLARRCGLNVLAGETKGVSQMSASNIYIYSSLKIFDLTDYLYTLIICVPVRNKRRDTFTIHIANIYTNLLPKPAIHTPKGLH